jgi:hypothetical protein
MDKKALRRAFASHPVLTWRPEKYYRLEFDGYWREPAVFAKPQSKSGIPKKSGLYCVFACIPFVEKEGITGVSPRRLLYIGESEDIRTCVQNHAGWPIWKEKLRPGQEVCITAALVANESDRRRAFAAMIFQHKPPCNTEPADDFQFDPTCISTAAHNEFLYANFTVERNEGMIDGKQENPSAK